MAIILSGEQTKVGGVVDTEVGVGEVGDFASAGSAFYEAFFYEVWLVNFLNGTGILAESGGNGA